MSTGLDKEHTPANQSMDDQPSGSESHIALSIVSNNTLLREGLAAVLKPFLDLTIVGSYPAATSCDPHLPNPNDHVILLDSGIGQAAAIEVTHHWRGLKPSAFVVVLELINHSCYAASRTG